MDPGATKVFDEMPLRGNLQGHVIVWLVENCRGSGCSTVTAKNVGAAAGSGSRGAMDRRQDATGAWSRVP